MPNTPFCLAAFRSRQAVYHFEAELKAVGIASTIVSTPRQLAQGCGLSLRFGCDRLREAVQTEARHPQQSLIGFYKAETTPGGLRLQPTKG